MLDSQSLLREATRIYDAPDAPLASAARDAWRRDFASGAEWMRLALGHVRQTQPPLGQTDFRKLGLLKYAAASVAALITLVLGWLTPSAPHLPLLTLPLAALAFYSVEVQWVFLFPATLDGAARPWRDSRALMRRRAGGTLAALLTVLPLAWEMLTGGWRGKGFVRSWCLGCLAVVLWYERCRQAADLAESEDDLPPLDLAHRAPLLLRRETLPLPAAAAPVRCLLVTDLHLTRRRAAPLLHAIAAALERRPPDAMILGGDLADSTAGLAALAEAAFAWTARGLPVLAVPGNHDRWLGLNKVRAALRRAGVVWLPDGAFPLPGRDGKPILTFAALEAWPATADPPTPVAAVLHDPADFPAARRRSAALALAGHLHGCQFAAHRRAVDGQTLPGAWFYPWNVLRHAAEGSWLIVSRGCADTLPLRWRCPREIVFCELLPEAVAP